MITQLRNTVLYVVAGFAVSMGIIPVAHAMQTSAPVNPAAYGAFSTFSYDSKNLYRPGRGIAASDAQAKAYCQKAVLDESTDSCERAVANCVLGRLYYEAKDYERAYFNFSQAFTQSHNKKIPLHAWFMVGIMYYSGQGRAKDCRMATLCFQNATNHLARCTIEMQAKLNLKLMQYDGIGRVTYDSARSYYDRLEDAATRDMQAHAYYWLGTIYFYGLDGMVNNQLARHYLEVVANQVENLNIQERARTVLLQLQKREQSSGQSRAKRDDGAAGSAGQSAGGMGSTGSAFEKKNAATRK